MTNIQKLTKKKKNSCDIVTSVYYVEEIATEVSLLSR